VGRARVAVVDLSGWLDAGSLDAIVRRAGQRAPRAACMRYFSLSSESTLYT